MAEELSPHLRAFVDQIEAGVAERAADGAFGVIREGLFNLQACTTLDDTEATRRANLVPSGTSGGWRLCTEPGCAPVQCAANPSRRHLLFDC